MEDGKTQTQTCLGAVFTKNDTTESRKKHTPHTQAQEGVNHWKMEDKLQRGMTVKWKYVVQLYTFRIV